MQLSFCTTRSNLSAIQKVFVHPLIDYVDKIYGNHSNVDFK